MTDEDKDNLWEIVLCNIDPRTVILMKKYLKLNFEKRTGEKSEETEKPEDEQKSEENSDTEMPT